MSCASFNPLFRLLAVLAAANLFAAESSRGAELEFAARVAPVLKTYCVGCHSGGKPKGELALDALTPDMTKNGEVWKTVLERLTADTMPPKGKPRPTAEERAAVSSWVASGLTAMQREKAAANGRARLRRLNRIEYVNTLRDLLGAEIDIETLPEDGVAGGFDNVDLGLDLSSTLLERHLASADAALDAVFVSGPRPETIQRHIELVPIAKQQTKTNRPMARYGVGTLIRENEIVFRSENQPPKIIHETRTTAAGLYRFRISAHAENSGTNMMVLIYAGNYGQEALTTRLVGVCDVPDKQAVVEFTVPLAAKESIRLSPHNMPNLYAAAKDDYAGPGLAIQWVEMEGPLIESWPPAAATRLFGDVDLAKGTEADAEPILRRFAGRAFRRSVDDAELAPIVALVKSRLAEGNNFAAALRLGLKAILCSPDFLYLSATPGKLNDFDLATRLSYFLWSSTPDDALLELAAKGELGQPAILRKQVERMLADVKAHRFTENFTGQWLTLREIKATNPDKKLYPDFDELLEWSMPQETTLFFEELLKEDRSVLEFVHADWSLLNERLAEHYGISGVIGSQLRKVALPPEIHRGGVMARAAVLKVTANGTNTSPVIRGAWVLDRILGTPAPPPPKNVPAIEPDVRGATTIREQLVKHRQLESCASCHSKIDPPGNALENFDVIGGWRTWYRAIPGQGRPDVRFSKPGGRVSRVGKGPPVEAGDELPGGQKFADVDGFKHFVLENPDQFARCLTTKLLVYATGHTLEFSDREAVEAIVDEIRPQNYGFRTLIQTIVSSPTFRSK
jgi:mono/diheme cytochrome c family protein